MYSKSLNRLNRVDAIRSRLDLVYVLQKSKKLMRERVETFALELQDEFELRILECKKYAVY